MLDSSLEVAYKLKMADVDKSKKWLFSLVRWTLLHPNASYDQVLSRINVSIYSQRGYFKKYNGEDKRVYNRELMGSKYSSDPEYKKRVLFYTRKCRVPYNMYKAKMLVPVDTKKVTTQINLLAKDMKINNKESLYDGVVVKDK